MLRCLLLFIGLFAAALAGCGSSNTQRTGDANADPANANRNNQHSTANRDASPDRKLPLALVDGQRIDLQDLKPYLIEASGGDMLLELVIERLVRKALDDRDLTVTEADLETERKLMLATLSDDVNDAHRMLDAMQAERGLGPVRFQSLLYRNAGLRKLVADRVEVTDVALKQAYEFEYGQRYQPRLILVDSITKARDIVLLARQGQATFTDLAIKHSQDRSRKQGGLLEPISPADPAYPQAIRSVLTKMKVGQVSDPVPIDNAVAILKLERKIPAREVQFADVKDALTAVVRRQTQRVLMEQEAKTLLDRAKVIVLDHALHRSWEAKKKGLR